MPRRGGARRAPDDAADRYTRRLRATGIAAAVALTAVVVGLNLERQDAAVSLLDASPSSSPSTSSSTSPSGAPSGTTSAPAGAATGTAAALSIVPGVRFDERILTVPEMKAKFGKQGLHLVDTDPTKPTVFTIASFNILGSSHTGKKGAASGPARAARAGALVRRKGISVVGLQEFQANQRGRFLSAAGGFQAYPGSSQGTLNGENSVAWDPGVWTLVEGHTVAIPYFFGKARQMPYVLLRNLQTDRTAWFSNYHNPADVFGCKCGGHRVAATNREVDLARELTADGTPMFTTGDMNDRDAYACRYAASGLHSADGVRREDGTCHLPGNEWIDWIWGSAPVTFTGYTRDYVTRKGPKISDHPIVTAQATIAPAAEACKNYRRHGRTYWFCPDTDA